MSNLFELETKTNNINENDPELDLLLEVMNLSGTNDKIAKLREYESNERLKQLLYYTYNPLIVFGISTKKLNKQINLQANENFDDLIDLLKYLEINKTGTDQIIKNVQEYISKYEEPYFELVSKIICKNLTIGISGKGINKVWKDLIPNYEVQQGFKYNEYIDNLIDKEVIVTQKFDGQRCTARVENGNVLMYSRNGKLYEGLVELEEELSKLPNGVYDGELLLNVPSAVMTSISDNSVVNKIYAPMASKELFKKTASIVNSNLTEKININFWLYDYTSLDAFDKLEQFNMPVEERKNKLNDIINNYTANYYKMSNIQKVPYLYEGKFDLDKIQDILEIILHYGQEGLMINVKGSPYEFKRSQNMLKVKKMYPIDLRVIDVLEGTGINKNKVGALLVKYKGNDLKVGSGLTKQQREDFWNNKNLIVGKIIEIHYFEETTNKKDNTKSLRFPIFKRIRADKDEESYN